MAAAWACSWRRLLRRVVQGFEFDVDGAYGQQSGTCARPFSAALTFPTTAL
ncbi:hypothetical protein [Acrocarpospora pleiomorpha]|uniref:hypothetical protein n=1 Tax=Acrocarpospora pleiomorpha TaxID=90975 RepID=UPI0012D2EA0D|nr:hypothetical protein [Acrocarpospora pleiomorpha]